MNMPITYENWRELPTYFSTNDRSKGALNVLQWAFQTYSDEDIVYASSFGAEAIVLLDLISYTYPQAQVVFLDTDLHFPETYAVIEKVAARYPQLRIEKVKPALSLEKQREQYGSALWRKDPNMCCQIRKVLPLQQILQTKTAWISGLRREQSPTRAATEFINRDEKFKNIKICPLIHWSWSDIWSYIKERDLPYNELHDRNYPSIGCFPCTSPVSANEDLRAGRWSGSNKTECGLHIK